MTPPECDPERVETVARAFYEQKAPPDAPWSTVRDGVRVGWLRYAERQLAVVMPALAALPPSPAEEAVKRVEAELDHQARLGHVNQYGATRLRAALASPAPAPQGEEDTALERQHRVASRRLSQIPEAYR